MCKVFVFVLASVVHDATSILWRDKFTNAFTTNLTTSFFPLASQNRLFSFSWFINHH